MEREREIIDFPFFILSTNSIFAQLNSRDSEVIKLAENLSLEAAAVFSADIYEDYSLNSLQTAAAD